MSKCVHRGILHISFKGLPHWNLLQPCVCFIH